MDWISYGIQFSLTLLTAGTLIFYIYQFKMENKDKQRLRMQDISVRILKLANLTYEYADGDLIYHVVKNKLYSTADDRINSCLGHGAKYDSELRDKALKLQEALTNYKIDFDSRRELPIVYREFIDAIDEIENISENLLFDYQILTETLMNYCNSLRSLVTKSENLVLCISNPNFVEDLSKAMFKDNDGLSDMEKTNLCKYNIDEMIRRIISDGKQKSDETIKQINSYYDTVKKEFKCFPPINKGRKLSG